MGLSLALLSLSGCASVGMVGAIYTGYTAPVAVTSNEVGTKVGVGSTTSVLGIIAIGEGGINTAAKNAGITRISHVDVKTTSILGLFTTQEYFVFGN